MLVNVPYQVKHTEIGKAEIILAINAGKARDILSEGDQISLVLEEGSAKERRMFVSVAKVKEDGVYCVTDDLVDNEVAMYEGMPRTPVSWSGSDARAYLNSDVLAMFPDILKINIMPREITQRIDGKVIHTSDKLWVPSYTEFFGREDGLTYPTDGKDEDQFSIFRTARCRVKEYDGVTDWHWTRTPRSADSGGSMSFRLVGTNGSANSNSASHRYGVCVGFCLRNL